jgi:integrase
MCPQNRPRLRIVSSRSCVNCREQASITLRTPAHQIAWDGIAIFQSYSVGQPGHLGTARSPSASSISTEKRADGQKIAIGKILFGAAKEAAPMAKSSNPKRKKAPKTVLKLPDLEESKSAVLNSLVSASSQRSYDHAIREFIEWYCSEPRLAFNKTVVTRYRVALEQKHYAPSTINLRLAAVRRLAYEASDSGLLSPDLAAGIRRVKGVRRLGVKIGNWLTAEEGRRLLSGAGNATLRERRNYAMLAVLAGCGLRRAEAAALKIEDLQLREGHWVLADLNGKGGHIRTVPVPDWVKTAIDQWAIPASIISGTLFRSINKAGRLWGTGFTPKVIWSIVKQAASNSGLSRVAPHDLRRTCAKLCHEAGGELEQIQFLLGHVSVQTQSVTWDANNAFAMQ